MRFRNMINVCKKISATIMAVSMMAVVVFDFSGCNVVIEDEQTSAEGETVTQPVTHTLRLTYSDDSYTEYFKECIQQFTQSHSGVKVILNQVDSTDYLKNISESSIEGKDITDVYLVNNSMLGTAYLAGLAAKNTLSLESESYCDAAIRSCSYDGNLIAYPLAFRTTFLAYNKEYVTDDMAEQITTLADIAEFAASIYEDEVVTDDGSVVELAPDEETKFDRNQLDLIDFSYVETIFECNLTDLFLNYGFLGYGMNIGGECGNDTAQIDIASEVAILDANRYLEMIDFYSIDKNRDYETIVNRFVDGKSIFTVMSTDTLAYMEEVYAQQKAEEESAEQTTGEGEIVENPEYSGPEFEFGVMPFPNYSNIVTTSPLSITSALAVNPYSSEQEIAEEFAYYATYTMANSVYKTCGLLSARQSVYYEHKEFGAVYESYAKSTPKNKMQYGEAVYPMIEIALHNIVAGEDPKEQLEAVDAYMLSQVK